MEVSIYLKKFKLLLEYVFDGQVVLNEYNTEKLLKFLEDRSDNSPGKILLETPTFPDLIFHYLEKLPNASNSVKLFIIEIITILFKNELQFTKMQLLGFQGSSIEYCIASLNINGTPPDLHLACIKLATVQISHSSGMQLLLEHKLWIHILYPNVHKRPIGIAKAAFNFVSQLVRTLNKFEMETELTEVLGYVVKPIQTSGYLNVQVIDLESDEALSEKIWTYVYALKTILDDTANESVNHIASILKTYFLVEHTLRSIIKVTRSTKLQNVLQDMLFSLYYGSIRNMLFSGKVDEVCNETVAFYHNTILKCIRKRDAQLVIYFCINCSIFWYKFEKTYLDSNTFSVPLTFQRNGQKFELNNQLILHIIAPLAIYASHASQSQNKLAELLDFSHEMLTKAGKIATEHIISSCYFFRTLIQESDIKTLAIKTVREIFRLKSHLTATQAGLIFQFLYCSLASFIMTDGAGGLILNESPIKCLDDAKLLSLVLDAILMLLKEHYISWYENIQIVSLQEGLMNLLKQNILNSKQIVQVLDLIDICVKKFLSPNMTLLVESRQDSTLTEIGAVMKMYMQQEDWEVRDSALNLLLSCTSIAYIKYIPLQKVITENKLMLIAARVALIDSQYYAQSTALNCLAAATKIESIWREVVANNPHIHLQLVYILRNNPEGTVRKEAARVLTRMYENQRLTANFTAHLYQVMMIAALDDLHWEVQLATLQFWEHVIKSHMTNRGMIDGKFPAVTFSKEKRKILKLNEKEIIQQLTSIMNDLSSIGCLTVLLECLNEVYNIEVMEMAYCIARKLIEILNRYKLDKVTDNAIMYKMDIEEENVNEDSMAVDIKYNPINEELRNKVIDSILDTYQSELMMELHDSYFKVKTEDMDEDLFHIPKKEIVHPNKFLETFKGTDYLSIIKEKKSWNADVYGNFDALLNEILDI